LDVSQSTRIRSKYIVEYQRENCTFKGDPTFCRPLTAAIVTYKFRSVKKDQMSFTYNIGKRHSRSS
jgi:hypothetical protein